MEINLSRAQTGARLPALVEFLQKEKTGDGVCSFLWGTELRDPASIILEKDEHVFHVQLSSKFVLILEN